MVKKILYLLIAVTTAAVAWSAGAVAADKGKTAFDLSHAEIFSPVKGGPLHYGTLHSIFESRGPVTLNEGPVTPGTLAGIDTYVIAGPAKEFTGDDIAALQNFVREGGNLLVLLHIAPPVARLTEKFGIIVSNFVIAEREGVIAGEAQDFFVTRITDHPVTRGIKKVAVYGSWGLMADPSSGAKVVASTSETAYADMNRNRTFDEGEPVLSFGIIAVSEYGKGRVVVVADDAPFANKFITKADNKKLAENIAGWLGR